MAGTGGGPTFARDFEILSPLAEGGMGAVYVARQISTGKKRALKIMQPELVADARARERFALEATIGSRIESEHVVEVVGAGIDEAAGTPWLAMELLEGQDLAARVRGGPLTVPETYEILRQLAHGLGAAHAQGIVHRDVKPENVFIARSRRVDASFTVKILDFGIAKLAQESLATAKRTAAIGSPLWMAPEQTDPGAKLGPPTDVWPLGLIVFHALTARYYWRSANTDEVRVPALLAEILSSQIEPPSVRAPALGATMPLPAWFDSWFLSCVARDPKQRYPDATAALAAIPWQATTGPHASVPPASAPVHAHAPTVPSWRPPANPMPASFPPAAVPPTAVGPAYAPQPAAVVPSATPYLPGTQALPPTPGGGDLVSRFVRDPTLRVGAAAIALGCLVGTCGLGLAVHSWLRTTNTPPPPAMTTVAVAPVVADAGAISFAGVVAQTPVDAATPSDPDSGSAEASGDDTSDTASSPARHTFFWADGHNARLRGTCRRADGYAYTLQMTLLRTGSFVNGTGSWTVTHEGPSMHGLHVGNGGTLTFVGARNGATVTVHDQHQCQFTLHVRGSRATGIDCVGGRIAARLSGG